MRDTTEFSFWKKISRNADGERFNPKTRGGPEVAGTQ